MALPHHRNPPQLPPKEEVSVVNGRQSRTRSKKQPLSKKIASTQTKMMCNAETQTDETDFYLMYQDEHGNWHEEDSESMMEDKEDEEDYSESNRSLSPDYFPSYSGNVVFDNPEYLQMASASDRSTVGTPTASTSVSRRSGPMGFIEKCPGSTPNVGHSGGVELRQAGRRKLELVQSVPVGPTGNGKGQKGTKVDPIIQGEINWSVSQLRSLFNQGQLSPVGGDNSSSNSSSGHGSSSSSAGNSRFTNGEYIESKPNKAARRQVMRSGRSNDLPSGGYSSHHGFTNDAMMNEADSDQESYV